MPIALVTLIEERRQWFKARFGTDAVEVERDVSFCSYTILGRDVMEIEDTTADPRFVENPFVRSGTARFYAGVPIVDSGDHALGTVCVIDRVPRSLTAEQRATLRALARQVAAQIDLRRTAADLAACAAEAIRARERLEAEQARLRSAEEADRAKDEFLATLSHELRTPLTAVLGWTHLLQKGSPDAALTARGLSVIARNAAAQLRLVEDLLDVSRIVTRRLDVERVPLDLGATVRAAADAVEPLAAEAGVQLATTLPDDPLSVIGDAGRLLQVAQNLLLNAVKFTPRGGRIDVHLDRAGPHARLRVADTGEGIPADVLPHVFEAFYQFEGCRRRSRGGLGLGLSIVKHLVEVHGGEVTVESPGRDQGTTFTVLLPVAPEE